MSIGFGDAVGIISVYRCRLVSEGGLDVAKDFASGGLVDTGTRSKVANSFEDTDNAQGGDLACVIRMVPAVSWN